MNREELVNNIKDGEIISKCDFSGMDLSGAELCGGIFEEVIFRKANLAGADLRESIFTKPDFSGADLSGVNMHSTV
ncbi:MAG: pentapeptide repeat-containing protein, partial [Desulfobacterales bacterium]